MAKHTTTLMNEAEALTGEACRLVDLRYMLEDAGHAGTALHTVCVEELAAVRAKRHALVAVVKTRDPGGRKNYVRAWLGTGLHV